MLSYSHIYLGVYVCVVRVCGIERVFIARV